ncbi:NAD-dependent epimerase/dehydratase family protein [Pseudalkalibacillus berkeleyi]|uniref:NAD-dependent epimerase/dehydratase family protein n=1 Tax=Pseudalkalibacillus berkeleyi TaxID=1069813 RepID=A0ABS9GVQ6_9BACL|nr:NAD-dependent epimerase/dehydratase family protein [Pseudalkalibacillus berkeleyi]MCF6136892.1 NAD-dependent epimerase/dehydratase family protein [Pseudalkalibacillus berkeleyi]
MRSANPRILITGATGFTGMYAYHYALEKHMNVTCIGRTLQRFQQNDHFVQCNLTNYLEIDQLIKDIKPDYVLHLAGFNDAAKSWENPMECIETNLHGTLHLLESIRKYVPECRTLVIGSALQFSPHNEKAPHPYSLSKTLQILLTQNWQDLFSMDVIVAKPSNLIGPGPSKGICSIVAEQIVKSEQEGKPVKITLNNSLAQCDFVDVRDVVKAYFLLLEYPSSFRSFEIGSGTSHTLEEVITIYKTMTQQQFLVNINESCEQTPVCMELGPIQTLGWVPEFTLQSSLKDILTYFRTYEAL